MTEHLWTRLRDAKARLKPVQSKYRVVFKDTTLLLLFKVLLFSLFFATSAIAQDAPDIEFPDEYNIDRINEDHYIVEYWNSGQLSSVPTTIVLVYNPLIVIAIVTPSAGPETFEVIVPPGWIAIPESITVEDGSLGRINIFREQEPPMMS